MGGMRMIYKIAAHSDVGIVKKINQDSVLVKIAQTNQYDSIKWINRPDTCLHEENFSGNCHNTYPELNANIATHNFPNAAAKRSTVISPNENRLI